MNLKLRRGPALPTSENNRSGFAKFVLFVSAGVAAIMLMAMWGGSWGTAYGQTVPTTTAATTTATTTTPPTTTTATTTAATTVPTTTPPTTTTTTTTPPTTTPATTTPATTTAVPGGAVIKIRKTVSTGTPRQGDNFTYTLVVTNVGTGPATNVVVTDFVPGGIDVVSATSSQGTTTFRDSTVTATLGTIGAGQSATVTITVRATRPGRIVNIAKVVGTDVGGIVENNSSEPVTVEVGGVTAPNPGLPNTGQNSDGAGSNGGTLGLVVTLAVVFMAGVVIFGLRKRGKRA